MKNIKLTLAYDGINYTGWQKNDTGRSIEEILTLAIETILRHPVKLQAASRTDAGVCAKGQVVNFFSETTLPIEKLQHRLNQLLPKDIVIKAISLAAPSFHPTIDAIKKEYRYQVCYGNVQLPFFRNHSWYFPHSLNLKEMQAAANHLIGSHDFSAFCNHRVSWDRNPICFLEEITITPLDHNRLEIVLLGDHFLYKMVRNLVGTLVYVGCGRLNQNEIPTILLNKDRKLAAITAPAQGLRLQRVFYTEID